MRSENQRGDLSVRLQFGRVYGSGPDRGQVRPALEITDQTSGKTLTIELSATDLTEMVTRTVKTESTDWKVKETSEVVKLPHIAPVIAALKADGYRPDAPRRNNQGVWVIIGRRYVDKP